MQKEKLILPVSILLASLVLGGFFYASQINKQESIERQQRIKISEDKRTQEAETKKEEEEKVFANNLKCQSLLKEIKQRWYNVVGIYYDSYLNTCIVKYTDNGEVEESPIEDMQDN